MWVDHAPFYFATKIRAPELGLTGKVNLLSKSVPERAKFVTSARPGRAKVGRTRVAGTAGLRGKRAAAARRDESSENRFY